MVEMGSLRITKETSIIQEITRDFEALCWGKEAKTKYIFLLLWGNVIDSSCRAKEGKLRIER